MLFFARYRLWRGSAQALEMWEEALERLWKCSGEALDLIGSCYTLLKVNRDLLFPIKS